LIFNLRRALIAVGSALLVGGAVQGLANSAGLPPIGSAETPQYSMSQPVSDADSQAVSEAMTAAKAGDSARIRAAMDRMSTPLARKLALWALVDVSAQGMSYAELEGARRDLADWPHAERRAAAVERTIEGGGLGPQAVIAWFAGADPATAEGAMALASAYQATGHAQKATELIRRVWRTKSFEADVQRLMLSRFGSALTADDHAAREDMLLYGTQGPAARDMLGLLSPDQQALAQARIAVRNGASPSAQIAGVPANLRNAPGLAYEQALAFQRSGDTAAALALMPLLPTTLPDGDAQARMWKLRSALVVAALKTGDSRAAYRAAANSGVATGKDGAEAEFYAGWLALSRLKDPALADQHFARLQSIGASPITLGRALYWRGRAMEAAGDSMNAQLFYADAARYPTTFYGQLAAAKAGQTQIAIGKDPVITAADRARFDDREPVRGARLLADIGARDSFKTLVASIAETLPSAAEAALLVDLARNYGDQELSMRVVRTAAMHGYILPERGYPVRTPPSIAGAPEAPFILGITRQESGFDPKVRSSAGAEGMMQLMPGTAQVVARKLGYSYGGGRLQDADFNMQLGSAYLGQLVNQFSGSYLMAAAAYNAGPGRPVEWIGYCGDPRSSATDPADYIECIPFSETRNYVMRVLEATEVYRARLAGGSALLTLASDLKRGGYVANPALHSTISLSANADLSGLGAPAAAEGAPR
jgi:soluble lytic murein transglycosylase